jgi:hypothetical protein
MILIISGEETDNKLALVTNIMNHAYPSRLYLGFPETRPPDFPKSNKVLVIISTKLDAEYPSWIKDHPFFELQTKPPLHSIQYFQSRIIA